MTRRAVRLLSIVIAGFAVGLVAAAALNPTELSAVVDGKPACPRCGLRGHTHAIHYNTVPPGVSEGYVPGSNTSVGRFKPGLPRPAWHCARCRHEWGTAPDP